MNGIKSIKYAITDGKTINNDFVSLRLRCTKLINSKLSKNFDSICFELFAWSFCMFCWEVDLTVVNLGSIRLSYTNFLHLAKLLQIWERFNRLIFMQIHFISMKLTGSVKHVDINSTIFCVTFEISLELCWILLFTLKPHWILCLILFPFPTRTMIYCCQIFSMYSLPVLINQGPTWSFRSCHELFCEQLINFGKLE